MSGHTAGTPAFAAETLLASLPVVLAPLEPAHAAQLADCADDTTFRWFPTRPDSVGASGVGPATPGAVQRLIESYLAAPDRRGFAIMERTTNQVLACSSFLEMRPPHRGLEIGSTWIAPGHRGTRINPAMKLAMLTIAFETDVFETGSVERGSAIRVQLKTHHENLTSRRAIEKLGATFEGILRNHMLMPDGSVRHSAMYSITGEEWPRVKAGLLARLGM